MVTTDDVENPELEPPMVADRYVRFSNVSVMNTGRMLYIKRSGAGEFAITKQTVSISKLLELTLFPRSVKELAHMLELPEAIVTSMVKALVDREVLEVSTRSAASPQGVCKLPFTRLCLGVSGSINSLGTPQTVAAILGAFDLEIEVVVTRKTQRFIKVEALEYFGVRTWCSAYAIRDDIQVPHAWLAEQCGLILIAPASANTLQKLASGACSDLLSLVVASTHAPVVVAPAMHPSMWGHPPIQRNVALLKEAGIFVLDPIVGYSASSGQLKAGSCAVSSSNVAEILHWLSKRLCSGGSNQQGSCSEEGDAEPLS